MNTPALPIEFIKQMHSLLGNDYASYEASFSMPDQKGLWINTVFQNDSTLTCPSNFADLVPIDGIKHGFLYHGDSIGKHPYHHSGMVYSQDPGAMSVIGAFDFPENAMVLDLCAAPGGKSSQIASLLREKGGYLVSNEPHPTRNSILCSNMERMGFTNVLVTKLQPEEIASFYPCYFDVILVDAPCSGEGMFRKYPESIQEWSPENVRLCADRQKNILKDILPALKPGGKLIYSTCTYNMHEDEEIVDYLLSDLSLVKDELPSALNDRLVISDKYPTCAGRFYPHIHAGEGQFMAYLQKTGDQQITSVPTFTTTMKKPSGNEMKLIMDALKNSIDLSSFNLYKFKDEVLTFPLHYPKLPPKGITYAGIKVGEFQKNRFIPHHAFFHAYGNAFINKVDFSAKDELLLKYLKGEEIYYENAYSGYGVICCEGYPIGGFKASNGRLKNHYPKGLRNT